ncbi:MAG: aminotransferase class III-fold pyridoxal phosphate-dependent enzyme [Candidatus Limnocylindria bacterium]
MSPEPADILAVDPPTITPDEAFEVARATFGVSGAARSLVSERDQNFAIDADDGTRWVLKVSNAAEDPGVVEMEVAAVEWIAAVDPELPVPRAHPATDGSLVARVASGGATHLARLLPLLAGRNARPDELDHAAMEGIGRMTARVGLALRGFFHPAAGRHIWWDQRHLPGLFRHAHLIADPRRRQLLETVIHRFESRVVPVLPRLRAQVIHNDITLDNLLVDQRGTVTGIIDFGDMAHTALVLDVPAALQSLFRERADIFEVSAAFLSGYTDVLPLEDVERELLGVLLAGRMAQTILISAQRTVRYPDNAYIHGWSEPAWALLDMLAEIGFDEADRRLASAARPPARLTGSASDEDLVARRRGVLGKALEPMTYHRPLHLVRGDGAWVEDRAGRRYLDAYNNVPVVGHAHPRVVSAIARQAALLNTNTRYLHQHVVELAERLTRSMPDELDTVMFVNSGSEANDLAWRLATAVTGANTGIVTDWAYHGVTHAIADFSPSEWPGGEQPVAVEVYAAPNTHRGPYVDAIEPARTARGEIEATLGRIADRGRRPAALFVDSTFTADGIFVPPSEVVHTVIAGAREAGALFVADEVQSGFGRTGDGLWGFTAWGTTPDIVTLGKPMGNGHPIAAVVTRADIADRFAEKTTFFSTFGGNPVACAAALAVLDVIEDEALVDRSASVGDWLRGQLRALAERYQIIDDVRGRGLMTGVELIGDRNLASRVKDDMAELGVLIGAAGRLGNVLKIRPPLCISREEAGRIVAALDEALARA